MLFLSFLAVIILGIILQKSNAEDFEDLQKLCKGQRYGTLVANPNDCNSFYVCQFIVQLTKCDTGLHFDRRNKVCNWPKFAGCDWVPEDKPERPFPSEEKPSVTGSGSKPSENIDKPETNQPKPSENKGSEESQDHPPVYPTSDDFITDLPNQDHRPGYPTVDDVITDSPSHDHRPGYPAVDDVITGSPNQDHRPGYPTVDEVITDSPSHDHRPGFPTVDDLITDSPNQDHRPGYPTVDDVITDSPSHDHRPGFPAIDDVITGSPNQDHRPGYPAVDDVITGSPNQDHRPGYPAVDDIITDLPSHDHGPGLPTVDDVITHTPIVSTGEPGKPSTVFPKPDHPHQTPYPSPPSGEEIDHHHSSEEKQDSSENLPSIGGDKPEIPKPPYIDEEVVKESNNEGSVGLPNATSTNHQWNLIASIISVESSNTNGFVNFPTAGAHSPQTGYPVDIMTGYDPSNVQCLYNGLYFLPHPSSCQKYFICAYRHLHLHSCGNGVVWNHKRQQCDLTGISRCYSRDVQSDNQSTEHATPLIDDQTEETTIKETTKQPIVKTTTRLPVETTVSHKLPICPGLRQVYLPNLDDCRKYFICIVGKPVLTSCPSGMHWDAMGEFCGKPSAVRCAHR